MRADINCEFHWNAMCAFQRMTRWDCSAPYWTGLITGRITTRRSCTWKEEKVPHGHQPPREHGLWSEQRHLHLRGGLGVLRCAGDLYRQAHVEEIAHMAILRGDATRRLARSHISFDLIQNSCRYTSYMILMGFWSKYHFFDIIITIK